MIDWWLIDNCRKWFLDFNIINDDSSSVQPEKINHVDDWLTIVVSDT